ncbi:hypothetical protein [Acinetobacter haemolyticus]|uniref:Uncharacterized protein n=2 Tax=Acinetobacter haemolyticus TaxID=29430 RepID=N9GC94_ACIHA|nr:hypothetical protein [Acinetobacter haemolyticus]ENW17110.1 hypothetical protein F927_02362 [Acinetobacter haemolyticus CIP 64.3 = MTCC 9819]MEB6676326.1 hypothetical protein [Acinetobacter haemolyticus]QHI30298.1 hypothetical protein AhaeINNSZ174_12935 [Acinetobacter haemolyticus]SPT46245.1 Uncharacterised protein [Acinetobacter haemolyticus]
MIEFYISQMAASILEENVKISPLLKSQTRTAPVKADIWRLRCEKEELIEINNVLSDALEKNSQLNSGVKAMVIEELAEICRKHT